MPCGCSLSAARSPSYVEQIADGRCTALPGAIVDIWHCDADGAYSGFRDTMVGFDTTGQKFLRGYQTTDAGGNTSDGIYRQGGQALLLATVPDGQGNGYRATFDIGLDLSDARVGRPDEIRRRPG